MIVKEAAVLALATVCALGAAGGVMQLGARAGAPLSASANQGRVVKAADGHYWAAAKVNGRPVKFLVDTGASAVSLTPGDAAALGIDTRRLRYDRPVFTAAGRQDAAPVMLDHIDVGGARVDRVQALVMRDGLAASLLGMSYLGRLSRMEATPETLVLSR